MMSENLYPFRIKPELHKQLKIIAIQKDTTLQDYVMGLIKNDMKNYEKKEERIK